MALKLKISMLPLLVLTVFVIFPAVSYCCGIFPEAPFFFKQHPDLPLKAFAAGKLGILQSGYRTIFLFGAYRHLAGIGFDASEQEQMLKVWVEKSNLEWQPQLTDTPPSWRFTRAKVTTEPPQKPVEVYRRIKYSSYLNCGDDSFRKAAETLDALLEKYGDKHPAVRDWVAAQDLVFENCSDGNRIPLPVQPEWDPIFKAHRTYQTAAAYFYMGKHDEARTLFDQIAQDPSNPWRFWAPYLSARALVRKASFIESDFSARKSLQEEAEVRLKQVLGRPDLKAIHPAARQMLNLLALRLHPAERLAELANGLLRKNSAETLPQALTDFCWPSLVRPVNPEDSAGAEMIEWICLFRQTGGDTAALAVQKWEQKRSLPWLVAAISKIDVPHPRLEEILKAADSLKPDSPAYLTAYYHSIRLLMDAGRAEEARRKLTVLTATGESGLPLSALNLFRAQQMRIARTLEEFLEFSQRMPLGVTDSTDSFERVGVSPLPDDIRKILDAGPFWDKDAADLLNRLPLDVLTKAAASQKLPTRLRFQLAGMVWVRASLLKKWETAKQAGVFLEKELPLLKTALDSWRDAKSEKEKIYASTRLMLHFPGLHPRIEPGLGRMTPVEERDRMRDNWWCAGMKGRLGTLQELGESPSSPKESPPVFWPEFITLREKGQARQEMDQLEALPAAPNYLSAVVLEYARQNPGEPSLPESLQLAVKSTRSGCTDKQTGSYSRRAFELLHRHYPDSPWTQKTPYWFEY